MPYKDESLSFTINGRRKSPVQTNIQYTTQDKGTAKLSFQLMKDGVPLPLSAAVVKLVLLMSDGSRFVRNIEITDKLNGRLTYVLSDEEIRHVGTVQAELDVSYTNQQAMSIHQFSFEIKKALIDTAILPSVEYYIDDFESLKNKINELYNGTIQTVEELREKFEDLENIETKDGAQKKADAVQANLDTHKNDKSNPHGVTKTQVGLGNVDNVQQATKAEFNTHNTDSSRHITSSERSNWNAKETTTGAQNKADTAEKNAKTYTDQHINNKSNPHEVTKGQVGLGNVTNDKQATKTEFDTHVKDATAHISAAERTKWNGAQLFKITNDVGGVLISIADTEDFLDRIVKAGKTFGTFYSTGKPTNAPSTLSTRGFFHFTSLDSNGNGTFGYVVAIDYKNNMYSNYVDGNLGWSGWKRLLTENDTNSVPWLNATYKNGAKTGDRQLQFKKVAGALHLTGHIVTDREVVFASIPSSYAPSKGVMELIAVSGITGMSKLIVFPSGDLKLTGLMANDSSKVTGYYIDKVIPLN
ncbi:BppU family phage baseplate upper protein [Bacillus halotolerans]|uniref:BppU family phage baseplate upper protein n=1 Tax=Bacillus halotolerans TaxID=260554 RepID=UPI002DBEB616|nr:BppU family phage baseplate upper protein [Bacillus halotolerans]MEC0251787.1 BppU family phage baseplate upper protein [Bacillus halotolerans]MEC0359130.1 BppU family phage baseplate upper protein [Bacillus halotolerans]